MKKTLIMVIGMTTLCVHGTTLEEARRILGAGVEESGPLDTPEKRERADKIWTDMFFLGLNEGDLALSVYCELLAEHSDNPKIVDTIMKQFRYIGERSAEAVNQNALDWARKVAMQEEPRHDGARAAEEFLSYKGDASDLGLVSKYRGNERLATRVAGTNIVEWFDSAGHPPKDNYFHFIPSVTNTGPQALYVRAILHRYWETLPEVVRKIDDTRRFIYRDGSKIPAELLTLVVWFDDDGNPVCNVDLAKYGLTMPEIDLPQNVKDEILRRARSAVETESLTDSAPPPHDTSTAETPSAPEQSPPPSRPWLYVGLLALLCAGVALWLIRKKR